VDASVVAARSAFFLRPNETPQLLARLASVLLAVLVGFTGPTVAVVAVLVLGLSDIEVGASGDVHGTWYEAMPQTIRHAIHH
jgi:hypothetical protein